MFSKSLFKQSCKAHGAMWSIVTVAVCFMLACVMMISGGGNIAESKNAIQNTIIEGELTSQIQSRAINYFNIANKALSRFDKTMISTTEQTMSTPEAKKISEDAVKKALAEGKTMEEAIAIGGEAMMAYVFPISYKLSIADLENFAVELAESKGYAPGSAEAMELRGLFFMVLNPMTENGSYLFDSFYEAQGETPPRYDFKSLITSTKEERDKYRLDYATRNCVIFLSGNLIEEKNINMILNELSKFGVTMEQYEEFGFNQYNKVKDIAISSLIDFRANYDYRMDHMQEGETEEDVIAELSKGITESLLASLPAEVSEALQEIGQADLYGTLIGTIFFKMAGLLLPIIYMIMVSNSLIAGQVDSGSMAYILSSSTKRRTVTFTQAVFLVGSLFLMFLCTTVTSIVCLSLVDVHTELTYGKLILINLGAFITLFAMSGICFLASCWFNRSKRASAIGGGLNMFFLVATMLGLFGSEVLPSIVRMDALNNFNYVSVISLFDVVSILEGSLGFIWKLCVLLAIGIVCYAIGSEKFARKDLPL